MTSWKQDQKCRKAHISTEGFRVNWFIKTLDYNPDDEWWCMRDDPSPYTYWTNEYRATVDYRYNEHLDIHVTGKDAANDLWKFLKHATLSEILEKYASMKGEVKNG